MSLSHKEVHQIQGEFLCLHCGKSWCVNDRDPPACEVEAATSVRMPAPALSKAVFSNTDGWPTPPPSACVAWLLQDGGQTNGPATVVYAETRVDALNYIRAILGDYHLLEIRRIKAMDQFARGRVPYFEANPTNLKKGSNASRLDIVSLMKFKGQLS